MAFVLAGYLSVWAVSVQAQPAPGPLLPPPHVGGANRGESTVPGSKAESLPRPKPEPSARGGLELADLEQLALSNNPGLEVASARVRAARGAWVQAGLPYNPVVSYQASEVGNEGEAGQQGAFVSQQFIRRAKLATASQAADRYVAQRQAEAEAIRSKVLTDVRLHFFAAVAAQRQRQLASQLVRLSEQGIAATEALLRAGEARRAHLLQAKIETNTARMALQAAENNHRATWQQLAAVVGVPEMPAAQLADRLETDVPELDWQQALRQLLASSPEMHAAQARVERAQYLLDREIAQPLSNVTVQAGVQRDFATRDNIAGVSVQVPVPLLNRNQGGIRRASGELAASRSELRRLELALQHRLAGAFQKYATARYNRERFRRDILPDVQETLNLVTTSYRQGEMSYLELLTAQRTFFRTHLDYVQSLRDLRQAVVQIEGYLLSGSLAP